MITWELVLSIVGIAISALALYFSRKSQAIKEVKSLENRLTKLESKQITGKERDCLNQLEIKMNLFWSVVESEFPKLLVRQATPVLDVLLLKAAGGERLNKAEADHLITRLDEEYIDALNRKDGTRARLIAFYKAVFQFNRNHNDAQIED